MLAGDGLTFFFIDPLYIDGAAITTHFITKSKQKYRNNHYSLTIFVKLLLACTAKNQKDIKLDNSYCLDLFPNIFISF